MSRPKRRCAPTGLCPGCGKRVAVAGKVTLLHVFSVGQTGFGYACPGVGARAKDVR
jgi:hypothetical protein